MRHCVHKENFAIVFSSCWGCITIKDAVVFIRMMISMKFAVAIYT